MSGKSLVDLSCDLTRISLETQSFFLLHLCLFREYLNLEFQPLWDPSKGNSVTNANSATTTAPVTLPFEYSLERIIDDFILLAVFVGNDFLPHLPDLHIHDNALEVLFEKYRETLPKAGESVHTQSVATLWCGSSLDHILSGPVFQVVI